MSTVSQSSLSKRPRLDSASYSLNEVASLFGLSYTTLWELVRAGNFPVIPVQLGRQYRFAKRSVDRLLGLDVVPEGEAENGH